MKSSKTTFAKNRLQRGVTLLALPIIIVILLSCSIMPSSSNDSAQLTNDALSMQQTLLAQQQEQNVQGTITAQQATIDAQSVQWTQSAAQPTEAISQETLPPQTKAAATEPEQTNPTSTQTVEKLSPEELEEKNQELDQALKVFVGREYKINELQEKIRALEKD